MAFMTTQQPTSPSRRDFLKTSTAVAAAGALAAPLFVPQGVFAAASDQIKVGLIGCGGRETGAAGQALGADKNVVLHAMGDMFQDQLDNSLKQLQKGKFAEKIKVNPDTCYTGFNAYQKVLDSGVDLVILTTPPAFRPIHLKAAVAAGKHIFAEKPIATDAPGVRSVQETVEEAKKKKLAIVSGFCWRYSLPERAIFNEIHSGRIGNVAAHYGVYNTGALWNRGRKPEWSDLEWQIRNWLYFTWLSGDHLVEQCVHTI